MGTNHDFAAISSSSTLRAMLLSKGEGILGSSPNLPPLGYPKVS